MRLNTILLTLGLALAPHLEAASSESNVDAALPFREKQREAEVVAPTEEMIDLKDIGEPLYRLTNKRVILDRNVRGMVPRRSLESIAAFYAALAEIDYCTVETGRAIKIMKTRLPVHGNLRTYVGSYQPQTDVVPLPSLFDLRERAFSLHDNTQSAPFRSLPTYPNRFSRDGMSIIMNRSLSHFSLLVQPEVDSSRQLPGRYYMQAVDVTAGESCSICLEDLLCGSNSPIRLIVCGHLFHLVCFGDWYQNQVTCPVCRGAITETNDMEE